MITLTGAGFIPGFAAGETCGPREFPGIVEGTAAGSDWYHIVVTGAAVIWLQPDVGADVDLYVYNRDQCDVHSWSATNDIFLPDWVGVVTVPVNVLNVEVRGTGGYTLALLAVPGFFPGFDAEGDECTAWNDFHRNGEREGDEEGALLPCPAAAPRLHPGPGETCTAWNDSDLDGTHDADETLVTAPCPSVSPGLHVNGNGTCTVYEDANDDGTYNAGEGITSTRCPNLKLETTGNGFVVYDDKNGNNVRDAGEDVSKVDLPPLE